MRTTILCTVALILAAGAPARAQVDDAAKAKLQAMADTVKQATSITYSGHYKGSGGFFSMIPEHRGDVAMQRDPQNNQWKIRFSGTRMAGPGQPALDYIVVNNGITRTWIDDNAKQVIERPVWNSNNVEHVSAAEMAAVRDFWLASPFERELQAPTISSEAPQVLDGAPCDVVRVDLGQQQAKFRYFIATTDKLPRKIEEDMGEAVGVKVHTLTNVRLNPPLADSLFKVDVPDGYSFVPATPPAPTPTAPAAPAAKQRVVGTNEGDLAPQFTLTNAEGTPITLGQLMGNVVVLDFWGTWCLPCKRTSPEIQRLHEKYKDEPVKIFGLAVREASDENPKKYMAEKNYTYGLLLKADNVAKDYKVAVYPTFFVIGKSGEIVHIGKGADAIPGVEEAIEIALGKLPPKPKREAAEKPAPPPSKPKPESDAGSSSDDGASKPGVKRDPGDRR